MPEPSEEVIELRRAAVMFPRLFLWLIGAGMVVLTSLGSVVVAQNRATIDETKTKTEKHGTDMADHETRIRLLEQGQRDIKESTKETRDDVKVIRGLIEDQIRKGHPEPRRAGP